jgi:deoxycytidine triphosphate deaminase
MNVLTKQDLRAALANQNNANYLQIIGGDDARAKIISYNPIVEAVTSFQRGALSAHAELEIKPFESIAVKTKERFIVPSSIFAICVNRVLNTHNQLAIDSSFIDPGYEGKLHFVIHNFGKNIARINPLDFPVCKIIFFNIEHDGPIRLAQDRNDIDQILLRIKQVEEDRQRDLRRRKQQQRQKFLIAALVIVVVLSVVLSLLQKMGFVQGDIIASISTLIAALIAIYFSQLSVDNTSA